MLSLKSVKLLIFLVLPITYNLSPTTYSSAQETLTITTYYPSPYGSYKELRSQHMAIGNTYYDRSVACWDPPCPGAGVNISDNATRDVDLIIEGSLAIGRKDIVDSMGTMPDLTKIALEIGSNGNKVPNGPTITFRGGGDVIGTASDIIFDTNGGIAAPVGLWFFTDSDNNSPDGSVPANGFHFSRNAEHVSDPNRDELMTISESGNVGIGTMTPVANLEIEADRPGATPPTGSVWTRYRNTNGAGADVVMDVGVNGSGHAVPNVGVIHSVTHPLVLAVTLVERMRIDTSGNVGIGETAPKAKLDVAGGVKFGDDTGLCDALHPDKKGTVRYNSTDNVMEYCDGTTWMAMGGGGYHVVTFDLVGSQPFTVPPGVTYLSVKLWGAGAGGGGAVYNNACVSCCETAGGGGGGGAYVESGYIVVPGQIYTITVGSGGAGRAFITGTASATAGADGGNTTLVNPAGNVVFSAGGGKGGKGATQAMCCTTCTTAGGGLGGTTYVITDATGPDPTINIIQRMDGEKGHKINANNEDCNGGTGANGGFGGNSCECAPSGCKGEIPGGGGSGATALSLCFGGVNNSNGGDGAKGKVVLSW